MSARRALSSALALRFFDNRYLLVLGLVTMLLGGYSALSNMPRIEDPRITNRYPRVVTFLPGASAQRVEALVTDRIEDSLRELSEIKEIRSTSRAGVSVVQMELQDYIGPGENQQVFSKMRDRLNDVAAELPAGATAPDFNDKNSAVAFSMIASIAWPGDEPAFGVMNRIAEELADRFRALNGTDNVRIYGEPQEEVSVTLDGGELSSLGLTAAQVAQRIASADTKLPAGALRSGDRDLFIEVDGELKNVDRVRGIPVISSADGGVVTVGDLADVRKDWRDPPFDMAYTGGSRSILVAAQTRRDIRLDQWASSARTMVDRFAEATGSGAEIEVVFDQSTYTEERLSTLSGNLIAGAGLVMLVVFVGMGWRAALIVGSSLPLSASLAVFGLSLAGQQIHQMSIFGMIIAIGLLIDNAIVMTDEVKKRLDASAARTDAIRQALGHLFVPLTASTLTTVLGFMPVFLLPGAMGDFVGPIAISVVLALTASFFISVTIIPALAGLALRRKGESRQRRWWVDGLHSERSKRVYQRFLTSALSRPRRTVAATLVLPILGFILAGTLGQQFFPPADRDQFEIEVWLAADASIARTEALTRRIEHEVRRYDDVKQVNWMIGGSYPTIYYNRIMKQEGNASYAHAMVYTHTVQGAKELTTTLPQLLSDRFPEARVVVSPFAQGPPVEAPVGFRVEGPNTAVLKERGDELRRIMHLVPDIVATRASVTGGQPKLSFAADEVAARQAGLSLTDIALQMQTDLEGQVGGSMLEDVEELPVRVRLRSSDRDSASSIASLSLVGEPGSGRFIPATSLGAVELTPEASSISRLDGVRSNDVLGYIRRDALAIDVTNAVLDRVEAEGFTVPPGYTFAVSGDSEQQSDALGDLLTYLPILLMLMVGTIVLSFRSNRLVALIGLVAVLSVGLGMLSLWIGGYARGFNAIIGSVGLVGVAINGTIVVLAAIRASADASAGDVAAVVRETIGATRHILSTTATTVGGFIPLLLFTGGDFWPPLAIVIAGGVGFSVTLSLVFTPAAYRWLHSDGRLSLPGIRSLRSPHAALSS
ncbi:MAG: efflux RND transporter permease subunit [Pseudomonadota bacterium]